LDLDWKGCEGLRKMCLDAPKYGNGDSYVDEIAANLYEFWAASANELPTAFGSTHKATAISITSHQPGGALTGATPDGRHAHEICADGTVSPMQGRDTHGPTAVIRSALRIDQDPYQATLMNMKFHPSALQSDEDLRKLSAMIKTYFKHGGKHVQFNVVSREMLQKAQEDPQQYRDLVVRVAGYSAYFTHLNRPMQDEVIARTELSLANI
jgi:pyruvate-formate lyase